MTDITKQLAEALRHIENAATDLRFQRYEIRAAATEALAAHEAEQAVPAVPDEWTRRMLLQAATAIEMGPRASLVMNVEGVVDNLRRIAAAPAPEAQDSARTSPAHQPVHGWTDADADAARLALELECILLDSDTPMPLASRWWGSAHEALALHRQRLASEQSHGIGATAGEHS